MKPGIRHHTLVAAIAILSIAVCSAWAQSGRGTMRGWVAFEDVGRNDVTIQDLHAHIELLSMSQHDRPLYSADTDEIGAYRIEKVQAGEFILRISAPGYVTYEIEIYIPSDFECNLATFLKKE